MDNPNEIYEPIILTEKSMDTELLAATKPPEERLFITLFYNPTLECNEYETFKGRTNCYRGIERILNMYEIDPRDITVLVEYVVRNSDTGNYEYALMHPDNKKCKNAYEFCMAILDYIQEPFDISRFTDDREGEDEIEEVKTDFSTMSKVDYRLFDGDAKLANDYISFNKEKLSDNINPNLFATPDSDIDPFSNKV